MSRRERLLAPTYRHFYDQPLVIERAADVWMYDREGRRYLDAYNNVPILGHCHPEVVRAVCEQSRVLNTHTRYITEEPLRLAEELLGTFPGELDSVVFTCTGSESNDLAVQVSRAVSGGTGFIITDCAYHGATDVLAGLSPEEGNPLGPGVYAVRPPLHRADAERFAAEVARCIERMCQDGVRIAALLVDTIFSSDGIAAEPRGFLQGAVQHVRAAGGLFIADEVQPGFGRLGDTMWGFERHDVLPDLVTLGKPMGNGYPVAALVGRRKLLEAFSRTRQYFSTYGGSNVACAAARAVLRVIRDDGLMQNARRTGLYLMERLRALAGRCAAIQDVRGAGLFIGVEFRGNAARGVNARDEVRRIVNDLRGRGVLVGVTSRGGNVLKIRPPLTFRPEHADLLVQELERAIGTG